MMTAYVIGVDLGSSDCKVMVMNGEGQIIATAANHCPIHYPQPGWAEQSPEDWYQVGCQTIRAALSQGGVDPRQARALCVDGPAHNVALLDTDGRVLRPTIHWSDLRSTPQAQRLEADCGDYIFERTFTRANPSWTLTQLLWLRENEPDVWSQLRHMLVTKDYLRWRLTGVYQTDPYDAVGTQLYDVREGQWSQTLCQLIGLDPAWLPPVAQPLTIAGGLLPQAAQDTGLPAGVPVVTGSGDSVVEAFGIGAVQPGDCIIKLGTAANVNLVTALPRPSTQTITYPHVAQPHWFSISATNSGAATMRWFRDTFCRYEVSQAEQTGASVYELIDQLGAAAPPGCQGLIFHPYLMGERSPHWDPHLRGDFVGIGAYHTIHHFARAVLEGVAFSIRDCLQVVRTLGEPLRRFYLIGGGARSRLWQEILCNVLGQELVRPFVADAAFGSALLAGAAAGVFSDTDTVRRAHTVRNQMLEPDQRLHQFYGTYFEIYQAVTQDLAAHSQRLAALADCSVSEQAEADKME